MATSRNELEGMYGSERAANILRGIEAMQCSIIGGSGKTLACAMGEAEVAPKFVLLVSMPGQNVRDLPLQTGEVTIGRKEDLSVVIKDDRAVSRIHACLTVHASGQITVRDLDSLNGTILNGLRIDQNSHQLEAGDLIRVGQTEILVLPIEVLD